MSIENPSHNIPSEETEKENSGSAKKFIKNAAAMVAVTGLGYAGTMEAHATDNEQNRTHEQSMEISKAVRSFGDQMFVVLNKSTDAIWGVELIPKTSKHGKFLAQRFVKMNLKDGKTSTIGEYDTVTEAAKSLAEIKDLPVDVLNYAKKDVAALDAEKKLEATGLIAPK